VVRLNFYALAAMNLRNFIQGIVRRVCAVACNSSFDIRPVNGERENPEIEAILQTGEDDRYAAPRSDEARQRAGRVL
jgi:hypothetical protein